MARAATVLVVDDEPSIRVVCRINLEFEGYRVLEAGSLDEARAALSTEPVDVLLLDLHVGAGNGLELVRELREAGSEVPAVLLTGTAGDEARKTGLAAAVLGKPFAIEALVAAVAAALEGPVDSSP
jgi:DNA-binding response OmpR family regulator